ATWNAAPLARTLRCSIDFAPVFRGRAAYFIPPAPCLARCPRLEHAPTTRGESLLFGAWRGGRVVECTALEMRHRCKPIGGSNPSLSAIRTIVCAKLRFPARASADRSCVDHLPVDEAR